MDVYQRAGEAGLELRGCTCPLLFESPLVNVIGKPKVKAYESRTTFTSPTQADCGQYWDLSPCHF